MYSAEEKAKAIKTYLENNCNAGKTVRELGYPTVPCMIKWAKECEETAKKRLKRIHRIYTEEEKQHAVELYFENDCNISKKQFSDTCATLISVNEDFLDKAESGDYCFVENKDISPYINKIEKIILFKWNRDYPADTFLTIDLNRWYLEESEDFDEGI